MRFKDMRNQQQPGPRPGEMQIPAVNLPITGDTAVKHVDSHKRKQEKMMFDAGIDLYPNRIVEMNRFEHTTTGLQGEPMTHIDGYLFSVGTGVKIVPVPGVMLMIVPRSSSIIRLGGAQVITGIIDTGYTGEYVIRILSFTAHAEVLIENAIKNDIALAQAIPLPVFVAMFVHHSDAGLIAPFSARGSRGFGSTDGLGGGNGKM